MKATVREYTVTKRVVVVELDVLEAVDLVKGPELLNKGSSALALAIMDALDADRASDAKEDEDVPF